ncbi:MAG TPA: hypothetical protein VG326_12195 [Tepidisphaeraceae bacterium]|jgi:hypothetical protein|nr:hypothetical protein [Tepidisphaeraceae bacterium]
MNEWTDDLQEVDADALTEFADELTPLSEEIDFDNEAEYRGLTLDNDESFLSAPRHHNYLDLLKVKLAKDHVKRLPANGEAIHMLLSGRYQLFHLVPAVLELIAPAIIDELHLCTLSYSKDNAADLLNLIDAGKIKHVHLLVSHYFSKANPHLFDPLEAALQSRGHKVLTCRSHAKLFLFKLSDGRKYVVHSSANMRSCKSIEQACFESDESIYRFYEKWLAGLFATAEEIKRNGTQATTNRS